MSSSMHLEAQRFASYARWPSHIPVFAGPLARAGLFYTGNEDKVQCFSCYCEISDWTKEDIPLEKHKRYSPNCRFILNPESSGNVPLWSMTNIFNNVTKPNNIVQNNYHHNNINDNHRQNRIPQLSNAVMDTQATGTVYSSKSQYELVQADLHQHEAAALPEPLTNGWDNHNDVNRDNITVSSLKQNLPSSPTSLKQNHLASSPASLKENVPSLPTNEPSSSRTNPLSNVTAVEQYVDMHIEANRLKTFVKWPKGNVVRPDILAAAGFYYMGKDDEVKCFNCRGRVLCWDRGDVPLEEHRKHFPNCPFLLDSSSSGNVPLSANLNPNFPTVGNHLPQTNTSAPNFGKLSRAELRYEAKRLETLQHWPRKDKIDINKMAEAGLYYAGKDDKVVCAFCNGAMVNWAEGDEPAKEHYKYFADQCPLVKGQVTNNVPLKESATGKPPTTFQQLNIITERPKHLKMASLQTRLNTYKKWTSTAQTAEKLADAGFFYTGKDDQVTCFYCSVGLKNWESNDTPWEQHARWSDNCGYVRQMKGENYMHRVKRELAQISTAQMQKGKSSSKGKKPNVKFDKRLVSAAMSLPMVMLVLDMGFEKALVKKVIEQKFKTSGENYKSSAELAEAVLKWKDEEHEKSNSDSDQEGGNSSPTPEKRSPSPQPEDPAPSSLPTNQPLSIEEENKLLKQQKHCKLCKGDVIRDANIVFLPCGHMVTCDECAATTKTCVTCCEVIRGTVKAFLG